MNHIFQPEFCLRSCRSYFIIRNLSPSLAANSVIQTRHRKHFFLIFSLCFLPYFLIPWKTGSGWTVHWSLCHSNLLELKERLRLKSLWQLQDRTKVVCSVTGILSLMGPHCWWETSLACTSQGHYWTSCFLPFLLPSFLLNASFPVASAPFPELTDLYLPLMRSCQLCSFQCLGVAGWVYGNPSSSSPHGKAVSLQYHSAVCSGDE